MTYPAAVTTFTAKVASVDYPKAADINTAYTDITNIETELGTDPAGSKTDLKTRLAIALADDGNLRLSAGSTITISSGVASQPTNNFHLILPQTGAADDLDTITATTTPDGFVLFIAQAGDTNQITFKHNTGNILCAGAADFILSNSSELVMLVFSTSLAKWRAYHFSSKKVPRLAASDPKHATAGSRPAGLLYEIVAYSGKLYFCTNSTTPTWEAITSS
jgi:hypothetical protein